MRTGIPSNADGGPLTGRGARVLVVVSWMALIFVLSAQETVPTPPGFDLSLTSIAGHFTVYAVLSALAWWALGTFALAPWPRAWLAFGIATLYGVSDEWHQAFVPGRHPDVFDVLVDAIGAAAGIAAAWWLVRRADEREP